MNLMFCLISFPFLFLLLFNEQVVLPSRTSRSSNTGKRDRETPAAASTSRPTASSSSSASVSSSLAPRQRVTPKGFYTDKGEYDDDEEESSRSRRPSRKRKGDDEDNEEEYDGEDDGGGGGEGEDVEESSLSRAWKCTVDYLITAHQHCCVSHTHIKPTIKLLLLSHTYRHALSHPFPFPLSSFD